ncbi:MAG: DUF2752 domain-containing protein [Ruminococcaceae bacterium]|nr:DUF2752 domain-containing protein [Oscillospiraceae bacterium]
MNRLRLFWSSHKGSVIGLSAIAGLCLLRFVLGLPCPVQHLFGISCPGCGMTRALWSLVTLDFAGAWYYHPASFALPVVAAFLVLFHWKGRRKATAATLAAFGVLLVLVYLLRLFTGSDVVTVAPQSGLVARILRFILPL